MPGKKWTLEDLDRLQRNAHLHATLLAPMFGRTPAAVAHMVSQCRITKRRKTNVYPVEDLERVKRMTYLARRISYLRRWQERFN